MSFSAQAQEASIELGKDKIARNQYFTITLMVQNERIKSRDAFPNIPGFVKRGTSSSSSMSFINGQTSSKHSITQNYVATAEGVFEVPAFSMQVNGQRVEAAGKKVHVLPPQQIQNKPFYALDPFNNPQTTPTSQEFVEVKDEALLALTTDKSEVYVGEGFTTTLAFYVAKTNQARLQFYDISEQLTEAIKELKPSAAWEENFNIENIEREEVKMGGKLFFRYRLYQAAFYPFNEQDIVLPSVGIRFIKFKVNKSPSFFGQNLQRDYKTFYTQERTVRVRALPPHPQRHSVAVGRYRLSEEISTPSLSTGEDFSYSFIIAGEGNISAVRIPEIGKSEEMVFYAPQIRQRIHRAEGRVYGSKHFEYHGVPQVPGQYALGDYFEWVYFDPVLERYDTLQARMSLAVSGESLHNRSIVSNSRQDGFYERMAFEDNRLLQRAGTVARTRRVGLLALAGLLVVALGVGIWRRR